jgi:hypothetical protein
VIPSRTVSFQFGPTITWKPRFVLLANLSKRVRTVVGDLVDVEPIAEIWRRPVGHCSFQCTVRS